MFYRTTLVKNAIFILLKYIHSTALLIATILINRCIRAIDYDLTFVHLWFDSMRFDVLKMTIQIRLSPLTCHVPPNSKENWISSLWIMFIIMSRFITFEGLLTLYSLLHSFAISLYKDNSWKRIKLTEYVAEKYFLQ